MALAWSIRYFSRALGAGNKLSRLIVLPFFWIRYLDAFGRGRAAADAASGFFFLGRRAEQRDGSARHAGIPQPAEVSFVAARGALRKALDFLAWRRRGRTTSARRSRYGADGKLSLRVMKRKHAMGIERRRTVQRGGCCRNAVLLGDHGDAAIPQHVRVLHVGHR